MIALGELAQKLDAFFDIASAPVDPAFSRFLPATYDAVALPWRTWFEPEFCRRYNGLMLRGADKVGRAFLAAFPSPTVLDRFIAEAEPGDLLFVHHPIDLESGDARGEWGRFFQPIAPERVDALSQRRLSIYSCHAPLDYHPNLSTSRSIVAALSGRVVADFFPYGSGYAGVIAELTPLDLPALQGLLRQVFDVPYLDCAGAAPTAIRRIAVVAGAGDRVAEMRNAESAGAQAYVTGEIRSRIATDYGRERFAEVERFAVGTHMALLGVSHAASEFLVMRTEMRAWFDVHAGLPTTLLAESHWWR